MPRLRLPAPVMALALCYSLTGCVAASEFAIEKSLSDIMHTECNFKALFYGKPFCSKPKKVAESQPSNNTELYCTETLGEVDCYAQKPAAEKLDMMPAAGPSPRPAN